MMMKKKYLPIAFVALMFSCSNSKSDESTSSLTEPSISEVEVSEVLEEDLEVTKLKYADVKAVNLWKNTLRKEPKNKNGGWVSSGGVKFGETLLMTGDTAVDGSYTYAEVVTASKKQGWIKLALIAPNYKIGVVTKKMKLYSSPDPLAVGDTKIEAGVLVATDDTKESGWIEIVGKEKKVKGWGKNNSSVSTDPTDLELATMLNRVSEIKDEAKKKEQLKDLLEDESYRSSALFILVQNLSDELNGSEEIVPENAMDVSEESVEAVEEEVEE